MTIDRIFQILAVALAGAAAYLFWIGNRDFAFAAVVLGCVAFFLSVRFQAKARIKAHQDTGNELPDDKTPAP
jgi:hypothetical protein